MPTKRLSGDRSWTLWNPATTSEGIHCTADLLVKLIREAVEVYTYSNNIGATILRTALLTHKNVRDVD